MPCCQNCSTPLEAAEGLTILTCCEPCFIAIMAPFSDINTAYAKSVRKLAQQRIKVLFDNQFAGYVEQP
jgi:hypothetical protein